MKAVVFFLMLLGLAGCASGKHRSKTAQTQFAAGQEEAFVMLQRSGIYVVRMVGAFQRPVVLWRDQMTLAEAILDAGYLAQNPPAQILIQRGLAVQRIAPETLLKGEDVPVEVGDVIHVLP